MDNEVGPAILKFGTYTAQPENLDIKQFCQDAALSDFFGKAVLYIGKYLGIHVFKYGLSRRMFERDYE